MNYRVSFREILLSDINLQCPFMPEPEEYEIHFQAIAQDLASLEGVINISSEADRILFITTNSLSLKALKAGLKPILQNHYQYIRMSKIDSL